MSKIVRPLSNPLHKISERGNSRRGLGTSNQGINSLKKGSNRNRPVSTKSIKSWPAEERPRERIIEKGVSTLSDAQLLAVLLRTGRKQASAVDVALDLLKSYGYLQGLSTLGVSELSVIPGIGPAKAAQLIAAFEVGKRAMGSPLKKGVKIRDAMDVYHHYHPLLRDSKREVFKALLLDTKHRVLKDITISTGSINLSIVHPREVFNPAVRESAAALIVAHNHPSGDPTPSREDLELTARLVKAGEIMGITLLDHLIIGDRCYVSLSEKGLMPTPGTSDA